MNKQLWNKALRRALVGMPIGLLISTAITIIISLCKGDGHYYAVVPALIEDCGSEINAVLIQFICSLLYGAVYAGATVVWETDWSLTKMTVVHLLAISVITLPIAYFMQWMKHSFGGFLFYFGIFIVIYAIIWITTYLKMRKSVDDLNRKVRENP
jgi:heme/copper-type cytochrome/quinol oxidase subunit 4